MRPLNYSRQALEFLQELKKIRSGQIKKIRPTVSAKIAQLIDDENTIIEGAMAGLEESIKIVLPENGFLVDDPLYKGIDESTFQLPYKLCALEYHNLIDNRSNDPAHGDSPNETSNSSKRIVLCQDSDSTIFLMPISYIDSKRIWQPYPPVALVKRSVNKTNVIKGKFQQFQLLYAGASKRMRDAGMIGNNDYRQEAGSCLSMISALSCLNVRLKQINHEQKGKEKKGALPFDDFHVLVLENNQSDSPNSGITHEDRNSPREHLRRGHIRRYPSGMKIWINSMIVNPGVGGKIKKDYAL